MKKFEESQEPMQFAISLAGEPTLYPYIGELVSELRKQGKTSFIVTNGLQPKVIEKMWRKKQLPTQIYVSLNTPNKAMYEGWHRSSDKNAWKKFNQTLELFKKIGRANRTAMRMTLVKGLNMYESQIEEYADLIKKANPWFLEIKGFMSVGYARKRLAYDTMPDWKEVLNYAKLVAKKTGLKILAKNELSRVVLVGKDKKRMKISHV